MYSALFLIDPLEVWLTGDLTNHYAESAILSDKQPRQEIKINNGGLELGIGYWHTTRWRYFLMFISRYD